jgi:hypothetical protein
MKTKSLIAALLLTASSAFAQVPSYVPTNGLVGWWPFNGNANDESGNGNNGTVNGATLTSDRFGSANKSYSFDGVNDFISCNPILGINEVSVSVWFKKDGLGGHLVSQNNWINAQNVSFASAFEKNSQVFSVGCNNGNCTNSGSQIGTFVPYNLNSQWHNRITTITSNGVLYDFLDGQMINSFTISNFQWCNSVSSLLKFGAWWNSDIQSWEGQLDDIAIWNRALTQQEVTNLYNAQSCTSNTITADGPTTFCAGNFVNLKSDVLGGTYQWRRNGVNISTNATSRTFKATLTGSYTCVATCNGTALTSNAIAVSSKTNASATVSASGATSFCAGDSVTLNATNLGSNYSVQWFRTNVSMENATNYSQVVKQPGTYKVVTRNLTNGCSRISGSAITTNVNCRIAGDVTSGAVIQENTNVDSRFIDNELSQGVHIYPNPNSGVFSFNYDGEETGDAVLQIINNMGQSIYQSRLTIPDGGFTQDLQLGDNITKGIYIVRLLINDSYHDSKVMVK